jgi:hypothetical protein
MTIPAHESPSSVSATELFFDLVFVFVITQITQLVEHAHGRFALFLPRLPAIHLREQACQSKFNFPRPNQKGEPHA